MNHVFDIDQKSSCKDISLIQAGVLTQSNPFKYLFYQKYTTGELLQMNCYIFGLGFVGTVSILDGNMTPYADVSPSFLSLNFIELLRTILRILVQIESIRTNVSSYSELLFSLRK